MKEARGFEATVPQVSKIYFTSFKGRGGGAVGGGDYVPGDEATVARV